MGEATEHVGPWSAGGGPICLQHRQENLRDNVARPAAMVAQHHGNGVKYFLISPNIFHQNAVVTDSGWYECQVNTSPHIGHRIHLAVVGEFLTQIYQK